MNFLEKANYTSLKIAKGMIAIFVFKLVFVFGAFTLQSCEEEEIINPNEEQRIALENFKSVLEQNSSVVGSLNDDFTYNANSKGNIKSEEEALEFLKPMIESSKELFATYEVTDSDIKEVFGDSNDPRVVVVSLAILYAESEKGNVSVDFSALFGSSVYAQGGVWECAGQALGFYAIAEIFAGQVSNSAILGAFKKVAARTLGWVGLALAIYEFGDCMGYW